jgi:hypothetical protein
MNYFEESSRLLRRMCVVQLLDEIIYRHLSSPFDLQCHLILKFLCQPGLRSFHFRLPTVSGMTGEYHYAQLFAIEMGGSWSFSCPSCPETTNLSISVSCIAGVICAHHHTKLLFEIGDSWTFCLGWPPTIILLILTSQVARITVVSHQCPTNSASSRELHTPPCPTIFAFNQNISSTLVYFVKHFLFLIFVNRENY